MEIPSAQRWFLTFLSQDIGGVRQPIPGELSEDDWQGVVNSADAYGLAPLLFHSLTDREPGQVLPGSIHQALRQSFHQSLLENMGLLNRVSQLLRSLAEEGIPVILLKGIYLIEQVYPSPALRSMNDIDLLLPRDRLAEAYTLMRSLGYQSEYSFDLEQECRSSHQLPGLGHPNGLAVELHWTLLPPASPFRIPIAELWERSVPINLLGVPCRSLSIEDLLLHLSLHTAYLDHFSSGLRPLCDLAWTLQRHSGRIDWDALGQQAGQWGAGRPLWLSLQLTKEFLDAPLEISDLERLRPPDVDPQLISWSAAQVLHPAELGGKLAAVWAPNPWHKRLVLFVKQLFPLANEMRPAYPRLARGLFWPLAYLWHLWIVLKRNWKMAWRLLRHDPAASHQAQQREGINTLVAWLGDSEKLT